MAGRSRGRRRRRRRGVGPENRRDKLPGAGGNHPRSGNQPTRVFRNRRFQARPVIWSSGGGYSTASRDFATGSGLNGPASPKNGGHGYEERGKREIEEFQVLLFEGKRETGGCGFITVRSGMIGCDRADIH